MSEFILSCSYGKDSLACIGACKELGWQIDRIVHAEVWATDTIPADLPPMVEFKKKADKIIKDRYGIEVEHICAMKGGRRERIRTPSISKCQPKEQEQEQEQESIASTSNAIMTERELSTDSHLLWERGVTQDLRCPSSMQLKKVTYQDLFYRVYQKGKRGGQIQGFPISTNRGNYCTSLKTNIRISNDEGELVQFGTKDATTKFSKGKGSEVVQYLGIASDEPIRIERHKDKKGILLPLVEIGWTEADAKQWCIDNDLLSPIYTDKCMRGGCWFCHNQGVDQLRQLRHNYPEYWQLLLKWDSDSPVTFHADGKTVHDFDERFKAEDEGFINAEDKFRWNELSMQQYTIFNCDEAMRVKE